MRDEDRRRLANQAARRRYQEALPLGWTQPQERPRLPRARWLRWLVTSAALYWIFKWSMTP